MFVERALEARDDQYVITFHLWASVALELLGKATLSHIHPPLVADPTHFKSILAASGHTAISITVRSITVMTVFREL